MISIKSQKTEDIYVGDIFPAVALFFEITGSGIDGQFRG
jgi:hypothetical protein